jgi:hypothetical protein
MTITECFDGAADTYLAQLYDDGPEACLYVWEELIHHLMDDGLTGELLLDELKSQLEMWRAGQKIDETFLEGKPL